MNQTTSNRLHDQLGNADLTRTSTAAFGIVDSLQTHTGLLAGECLGALTAAFILAVEASGIESGDICGMTRNIMADANGRRPEFKAITDYLKKEIF